MSVFLGVLVAFGFGAGDFAGGRASMRAPTSGVMVVSQACGLVVAIVLALVVGARVATHDIVFGLLSGAATVVGLGLLYRGLATAAMGVVAPVTAVFAAIVPVVFGVVRGERPAAVVFAGIVLAIGAATLIAYEPSSMSGRVAPGVLIAIGAGAALGSSLVFYSEASDASGMWPVLASRFMAFALAGIAWVVWFAPRGARLPTGNARSLALVAGVFDVAASALIVLAVRKGLVSVVAALAALAPGFTVVFATVFLRERLQPRQRIGLAIALVGLVLIATG